MYQDEQRLLHTPLIHISMQQLPMTEASSLKWPASLCKGPQMPAAEQK